MEKQREKVTPNTEKQIFLFRNYTNYGIVMYKSEFVRVKVWMGNLEI